ncbi:MAG: patatin-like phospholipase family protein [Geminicoccaceae bacterium]
MSIVRTPGGDEIPEDGGPIGLALSGSGLKASLFHIGMLARLAELDLLRRIDVISATSGGALIAALYYLRLKCALDADGDIDTGRLIRIVAALERGFLAAVQTDLRARLSENPFANLKQVCTRHSSATRLGDLLEHHLFRPVWNGDPTRPIEMRELSIRPRSDRTFNPVTDNRQRYCKVPELIINAANLGSGRAWRFDAERMGEPTAGPAARRLSKAPLLARSHYRRLPTAYAGMTLGHAVAASMAAPGLLEPLRLHRLYPDPERPSKFLDIRLVDGQLADALGTEALLERGCSRLIISDASGFETAGSGSNDRARALQLEALEARRPGGVVLIHLLSEIEALEVKPLSPVDHGHIVKDRTDQDATSYGVERRLQKLIACMRADFDAPSEVEAMSLMADGYLIAKRALHRLRHRGQTWAEGSPRGASTWRFTAVIDALRQPPKKLVKHLKTARLSAFKAARLAIGQTFGQGFLALAAMLALITLAAFWSALRPEAGADRLWIVTTTGLLMLTAWLAGRHVGESSHPWSEPGRVNAAFSLIGKLRAIALALPLALGARFRRSASRAFLKAGQLKRIGIEPIKAKKRTKDVAGFEKPAPARTARKAA